MDEQKARIFKFAKRGSGSNIENKKTNDIIV
jgi:hypothetical protein